MDAYGLVGVCLASRRQQHWQQCGKHVRLALGHFLWRRTRHDTDDDEQVCVDAGADTKAMRTEVGLGCTVGRMYRPMSLGGHI